MIYLLCSYVSGKTDCACREEEKFQELGKSNHMS